MQNKRPRHDFISGLFATTLSVSICHPLEVVRTRLNLQNATSSQKKYNGFIDGLRKIFHEEGFHGFYKVITVPLFFGLFFTVYNKNKYYWSSQGLNGFKNHLLSSLLTGTFCDILTNPLWVYLIENKLIRTRMQTQFLHDVSVTKYTGLIDAFRTIYREEGFFSFYKGLGASLLGLSHVMIQFPTYEHLKLRLAERRTDGKLKTQDFLAASLISKICACLITYPHVVLRTRLHDNRQRLDNYNISKLIWQVAKNVHSKEGFLGFYRGLQTDMIRVLPMTGITFLVYEKMNNYFGNVE